MVQKTHSAAAPVRRDALFVSLFGFFWFSVVCILASHLHAPESPRRYSQETLLISLFAMWNFSVICVLATQRDTLQTIRNKLCDIEDAQQQANTRSHLVASRLRELCVE